MDTNEKEDENIPELFRMKDRYPRATHFVFTKNKEITQERCLGHSLVTGPELRETKVILYFAKCVKVPIKTHKDKLTFDGIKPQIVRRIAANSRGTICIFNIRVTHLWSTDTK